MIHCGEQGGCVCKLSILTRHSLVIAGSPQLFYLNLVVLKPYKYSLICKLANCIFINFKISLVYQCSVIQF